jgi:hypothetical protein
MSAARVTNFEEQRYAANLLQCPAVDMFLLERETRGLRLWLADLIAEEICGMTAWEMTA